MFTAKRKQAYEALYPETRAGVAQGAGMKRRTLDTNPTPRMPSFAADTASKTGRSMVDVQRDARRGANVTPEAVEAIKGTALDKCVVLDKLAALPAEQQMAAVAEMQAPAPEPEPPYSQEPNS